MRILKICLGLILIVLGVIVFNKYKSNDLSLEKDSFMDTVFVDEKPLELTFEDYNLESKVSEYNEKITSKQVSDEYNGFKIYADSASVYGVDENRKLKLFNIESSSVKAGECKVESFTNVLGKAGIKFTVVDDRGKRTLYFYDNPTENSMVLFADELNAHEMYLGNDYLSIVTEDKNGLINSIITKDSTAVVKKASIDNKENDKVVFDLKANYEEDTFILSKVNKYGYTQTSPYIFEDFQLVSITDEIEIEEAATSEASSVEALKTVYPIYDGESYYNNKYVTDDGVFIDSVIDYFSIDEDNLVLNTGKAEHQPEEVSTLDLDENYKIAKRINSDFAKVTGYYDENHNDGFTYVYYKINEDYYAVKNVEHNNYCFINAEGAEVTSFKFYNEPKAFGEYIFVQDDKEAYFLNGKLEKVTTLPSLKGYYTLKSYEGAFANYSTTSDKIFISNAEGQLLYETENSYEYNTFKFNESGDSIIEGSEIIYTISSVVYNANFNYNSEYAQITGLENIVAEEQINHTLKKYSVNAVDDYKKNTDAESILLNKFFVAQEISIENKLLIIKQIETLKDKDGLITSTNKNYYFDMDTGSELYIKDIFKKGYEDRLIEELNFITSKVNVNIDSVGEFYYGYGLNVTYKKGEVGSEDVGYIIELPLENLTDVIDFESATYKSFNKNSEAFSSFVPNQTRSLMFVKSEDYDVNGETKYLSVRVKHPQFVSDGADAYATINEYYMKRYDEQSNGQSDIHVLETDTEMESYYLSETLLQNRFENVYIGANYNPNYVNDLWDIEKAEKLTLYNLFDLEVDETEEFLDNIIYSKTKAFSDTNDYDEDSGRRYPLLDIYRNFTNEKGERNTEVGTRAIDAINFDNDWFLTKDGLYLVYQEYILGGNGSDYKFFIPYEDLSENLTPEIREALKLETK